MANAWGEERNPRSVWVRSTVPLTRGGKKAFDACIFCGDIDIPTCMREIGEAAG